MSDRGDKSPQVRDALNEALSGQGGGAAGMTPAALANIAAKAKSEKDPGAGKLTPDNLPSLMRVAVQEPNRRSRSAFIQQVAKTYAGLKDPEAARDALQKAILENPEGQRELIKSVNEIDCGEPVIKKENKS